MDEFKSGFVALLGKPNAGKSTLVNKLMGEKLAAVSALAQTTRDRFHAIYTDDHMQMVFVDLPGVIDPNDKLNKCLFDEVADALAGVDLIIHLVEAGDQDPYPTIVKDLLTNNRTDKILVLTKVDGKYSKTDMGSFIGERVPKELKGSYSDLLMISSYESKGLDELLSTASKYLNEGPPLYDPEQITDRDLRYLCQEMIREKLFLELHQELPYSTVVEIDDFKERANSKWYIAATIYVERDSQKGMVVGKGGKMLKKISASARKEIEIICQAPVFLELWVKVRENWRKNDQDLKRFGYRKPRR